MIPLNRWPELQAAVGHAVRETAGTDAAAHALEGAVRASPLLSEQLTEVTAANVCRDLVGREIEDAWAGWDRVRR